MGASKLQRQTKSITLNTSEHIKLQMRGKIYELYIDGKLQPPRTYKFCMDHERVIENPNLIIATDSRSIKCNGDSDLVSYSPMIQIFNMQC